MSAGRWIWSAGWPSTIGEGAPGAKTTRGRAWALVYAEKHRTRGAAMRREYRLKKDRAFRAALRALPAP